MRTVSRSAALALLGPCVLLVTAAAVCLLAGDASSATIHVPGDESTINGAIALAGPGDTVLVSIGNWDERVVVDKRLTLRGADARDVVLSSSRGEAVITVSASGVTISDLRVEGTAGRVGIAATDAVGTTVDGVTVTGCERGILVERGSQLTISGCEIRHSVREGIHVLGEVSTRFERVTISDSTFARNGGDGVLLERCRHVEMDRLTMIGNRGDGLHAVKVAWVTLRNCSVDHNDDGFCLHDSHGWTVEDNIIKENRWNGIELNQSGEEIDNHLRRNLVSRNSQARDSSAAGILFFGYQACDNHLEWNTVVENPVGFSFISYSGGCRHNHLRSNTVRRCGYGIWESAGTGPNQYLLNNLLQNSVTVASVNKASVFDDGDLGNYWSDYTTRYPTASREGAVWTTPYRVREGLGVFDERPLAYEFERDPPEIDSIVLLEAETIAPGFPAAFGLQATDASAVETIAWSVTSPDGLGTTYTTNSYRFTFTFSKRGQHWVGVEVTDVWGLNATLAVRFDVLDTIPPLADAGSDVTANLGSTITLDGTGSSDNHGIASISWAFDPDGLALRFQGPIAELSLHHLGIYNAILFVVDYSGNSATDTVTVRVEDLSPPVAVATSDHERVGLGDRVTFDGSLSHDNVGVVKWRWTVQHPGVQFLVSDPVFDHTFIVLGEYLVTLTVQDAAGSSASTDLVVNVRDTEPPVADAGPEHQVLMGTRVTLDAGGSSDDVGIVRTEWTFYYRHENNYLFGTRVSFRFDLPGKYLVTLVVYDAAGNHDTDTTTVTVVDTDPPVAVYWVPEEVSLGETITMDASGSTDNLGVTSYEWRVVRKEEALVLEGVMVNLPLEGAGTYKVTLTVRDAAGNEDVGELTFYVAPEESGSDAPSWLVPGMVAVLVVAVLSGWLYSRRRYAT